jgi:chromosomal replication initiator protein
MSPYVFPGLKTKPVNNQLDRSVINRVVAHYFNLKPEELRSKTRKGKIRLARQFSQYLMHVNFSYSLEFTGFFYGQDHATALHSKKVIEQQTALDKNMYHHFTRIINLLYS